MRKKKGKGASVGLELPQSEPFTDPLRPTAPNVKIDLALAVRLRIKDGLTFQAIADHFGVSESGVRQAMQRFLYICDSPEQLATYREQKSSVFETLERVLIERLLSDVSQGKGSVGDLAKSIDVLSKHVRLLAGQSTQNIGLLVSTLSDVHKDLGHSLALASPVPTQVVEKVDSIVA